MEKIEVISYHLGGNSFPIVIQQGKRKFLVKLRAGLSGEYSLLCEWFGNRIGSLIGLNTRQPYWITLTDSLEFNDIYIEVRDLIVKSLGVNIGFDYFESATAFDVNKTLPIAKEQQVQIFLLDLLMLNIDRTNQNQNLLLHNDHVFVTDFDSSMIFNNLINNKDFSENEQILRCFKSNPFYQKVDDIQLQTFINKIKHIDYEKIIFEIPNELISAEYKELICKRIDDKITTDWNLRKLLDNLENIDLETELEKNIRINKNREKLEKLVSSTHNRKI
ncbi:HipA family kinase [Carboxylicivirga sp. N1Y90]|uniref:HipA family kinase n=1 Tax=Carboxylicivirga fragile TaxID=3417571 RepID=UPI003D3514D6|nr:hypothetical protein [Marinilabiliaceae bacterium N1Y90]